LTPRLLKVEHHRHVVAPQLAQFVPQRVENRLPLREGKAADDQRHFRGDGVDDPLDLRNRPVKRLPVAAAFSGGVALVDPRTDIREIAWQELMDAPESVRSGGLTLLQPVSDTGRKRESRSQTKVRYIPAHPENLAVLSCIVNDAVASWPCHRPSISFGTCLDRRPP
jgi:hypothetical protein